MKSITINDLNDGNRVGVFQSIVAKTTHHHLSEGIKIMFLCHDDILCSLESEYRHVRKNNGSAKPITLENGRQISNDGTCSIYTFSMLSDQQVPNCEAKFVIDQTEYQGVVNFCYGRNIEVTIIDFFVTEIESALMYIDSSLLLEKLITRYKSAYESPNDIVSELNKLHNNIPEELQEFQTGQEFAIQKSVASDTKISIIWGPPGTGKTWTLGRIAYELYKLGNRVLIVSLSNVAVDSAIMSVIKSVDDPLSLEGVIFRYGYAADKELIDHAFLSAHSYALKSSKDLVDELHSINERLKSKVSPPVYKTLNNNRLKIKNTIHNREKYYIENAGIVATTAAKAYVDSLISDGDWDCVIYDEASMASIPYIYVMAKMAKSKMIILGDFKQLPPISEAAQSLLQTDIFEYLHISNSETDAVYKHPNLVVLDIQRRMVPQIGDFVSTNFYCGLLKNAPDNIKKNRIAFEANPFSNHAFTLIDTSLFHTNTIQFSDSRVNIISAGISACMAIATKKKNPNCSIGIITPYSQQAFLINSMLKDCEGCDNIQCATVHQFQGNEKDIIIFDLVESGTGKSVTDIGRLFLSKIVNRLINVSLTRAKAKLILVADKHFFSSNARVIQEQVVKLIKHASEDNCIIDSATLSELSSESSSQSLQIFDTDNCYAFFEDRLEETSTFEYINSVFCDVNSPEELTKLVDRITNRGKRAVVYTSGKSVLIKSRKGSSTYVDTDHCTHKAPNDFSVVDEKEFWFGNIEYHYLNGSRNGHSLCLRCVGENSLIALSSILNLEYLRKYGSAKIANSHISPMKIYVQNNQSCDKCGLKTIDVKKNSTNGVYFVKCKSCGKTGDLSQEIIDQYMNKSVSLCKECNGPLTYNSARQYFVCKKNNQHIYDLSEFMEQEQPSCITETKEKMHNASTLKINSDGTISFS